MRHPILFTTLLSMLLLFSCNSSSQKDTSVKPNDCTEYACPMHPDHTSTLPAKCPECNMDMEAVRDTLKRDSVAAH